MKGKEMSIHTKLPMEVMLIPSKKWLMTLRAFVNATCLFVLFGFLRNLYDDPVSSALLGSSIYPFGLLRSSATLEANSTAYPIVSRGR